VLQVLLHVKDPRLAPSRTYFDTILGWQNITAVHMPAQMAAGEDYLRLYGGCGEAVIAFSHLYAAFDGFSLSAPLQRWWEIDLAGALVNVDSKSVKDQAAKLKTTLRMNTGRFS